jgi:hypothetical protein
MTARALKLVQPADQPEPDLSYESRERRFIASRNWAGVHVAGDRADALEITDRPRRWWRG